MERFALGVNLPAQPGESSSLPTGYDPKTQGPFAFAQTPRLRKLIIYGRLLSLTEVTFSWPQLRCLTFKNVVIPISDIRICLAKCSSLTRLALISHTVITLRGSSARLAVDMLPRQSLPAEPWNCGKSDVWRCTSFSQAGSSPKSSPHASKSSSYTTQSESPVSPCFFKPPAHISHIYS